MSAPGAAGRSLPGAVYLSAEQIAARVAELGAEIADDYAGRDLVLVASLKASVVLCADLSRAVTIPHALDTIEIEPFRAAKAPGSPHAEAAPPRARILKDVDLDLRGRDVLLVEDVVDTGLTLSFFARHVGLAGPRSLAAVALLDRPYRRLVPELPLRYVGFAAPDELFVGYGFDLEERYRNLPDIHLLAKV